MKAIIEPPKERMVTLEMTESEAILLLNLSANLPHCVVDEYFPSDCSSATNDAIDSIYKALCHMMEGGDNL